MKYRNIAFSNGNMYCANCHKHITKFYQFLGEHEYVKLGDAFKYNYPTLKDISLPSEAGFSLRGPELKKFIELAGVVKPIITYKTLSGKRPLPSPKISLKFDTPVGFTKFTFDHLHFCRIFQSALGLFSPAFKITNKSLKELQKAQPELAHYLIHTMCKVFLCKQEFYYYIHKSPFKDLIRPYIKDEGIDPIYNTGYVKEERRPNIPDIVKTIRDANKEDSKEANDFKVLLASHCGQELRCITDRLVTLDREATIKNSKELKNRLWAVSRKYKKRISYLLAAFNATLGDEFDNQKTYIKYLDDTVTRLVPLLTIDRYLYNMG